MVQILHTKDIIRIYHENKSDEKIAQLTNSFFLKTQ